MADKLYELTVVEIFQATYRVRGSSPADAFEKYDRDREAEPFDAVRLGSEVEGMGLVPACDPALYYQLRPTAMRLNRLNEDGRIKGLIDITEVNE